MLLDQLHANRRKSKQTFDYTVGHQGVYKANIFLVGTATTKGGAPFRYSRMCSCVLYPMKSLIRPYS